MKKMKIGIPVCVYLALVYFSAIQSPLCALVLILCALVIEQGGFLAEMLQPLAVLGVIWAVQGLYAVIGDLVSVLNSFMGSGYLHMPYGLSALIVLLTDGALAAFGILSVLGKGNFISAQKVESLVSDAQSRASAAGKEQ